MIELYDWQKRDLEYILDNGGTGLLALEPGAGKTVLACHVAKELQPDVTLIIAPQSTHFSAWAKTVLAVMGQEIKVLGTKNKAQRGAVVEFELGLPGVYVVTPQYFSRKTTDRSMWRGDLLIADEVHQMATMGSSGNRALSGYSHSDDPINTRFMHRLALSGTPMRQNFQNFWAIMRFLWPERDGRTDVAYSNPYVWSKDRMSSEQVYTNQRDQWGNPKQVTNFLSEAEPGKLVSEMPCVVIHKRRERCCEFHPEGFLTTDAPQVIEHVVELTAKQKKAIRELESHYMTYLDDNPFVVDLTMVQKQRIRQICLGEPRVEFYTGTNAEGEEVEKTRLEFEPDCHSPFLDEALAILDKLPKDEPVTVFLESQRFAEVAVARLNAHGYKAEEYSGVRKADLDGFGVDYQVLVGVSSSIGTGTDGLQEKCQTEIILEESVSITVEDQRNSRNDRLGSIGQVQRYRIIDDLGYASGRISENLAKRLATAKSLRKVA